MTIRFDHWSNHVFIMRPRFSISRWLWLVPLFAILLPGPAPAAEEAKPIRALLVIGGCCHDYSRQQKLLTEGISARANVEWTIVHEGDGSTSHKMSVYDDPDWPRGYDVIVHDECSADVTDKEFVENILKPHRAGLPAVNLHCAMHSYRVDMDHYKEWFAFTGLETRAHGAQLPIALHFANAAHPVTQGMTNWTTIPEELYNNLHVWETVTPLIYGAQGGSSNVVAWVNDYHGARVFCTTLGHNNETVNDPRYLDLLARGLLWSVDKLNADYLKPAKRVLSPSTRATRKIIVPNNLALGKPATASASQDGHEPGHAVDDDPETRWCAPDNGNGYWWQVDLQKPEEITGCRIFWEMPDKAYQYTVAVSADGKDWQTMVTQADGQPRPQNDQHKFSARDVRYVRIIITRAPEGSWSSFWEFEVFGTQKVEKTVAAPSDARLREVKVPAGFNKTIFAAPPDISYPTCVAAAPTGEVFVGMDLNGSLDAAPDRGSVVRCVDTDGDGVADKFNVFAKMDSPRGLVVDGRTLYVMHPPVLEAYYDDNGDGVADRSEVLVRGLGHDLKFRGADHTCNGVRMGIDGWLYIALGDYGALRAVAKDGSELQLHGGGILRVRPDGSELELVVRGTRNIYDVAIDPELNLFTCDNTNDGDGWNTRLAHDIPTANYGYPSLFKNFDDEIMPPLDDYGGGSPTGSLFLDEPGFPGGYGRGLYTCQWGWSNVSRHPLQPDGATFKAGRETFIDVPRPTGIDADGQGNVYVASWKGAAFNYAGPNVGYIVRVTPAGYKQPQYPDLKTAEDGQLLMLLVSDSAFIRFHAQREILRRGPNRTLVHGLESLLRNVRPNPNRGVRVAVLFTLKQLLGERANDFLRQNVDDPNFRPYALRALADRRKEAAGVPTEIFVKALADKNPAARLQAIIALNRLGRTEAAGALLPLTGDADAAIAHTAFQALVSLRAGDACLKALDHPVAGQLPGALRVLRNLHEPAVVDGLIARLDRADGGTRHMILQALCRLYFRESEWDGSWWGTRPDTTGPFFTPVTWDQSPKISQALQAAFARADEDTARCLLTEFPRHKLNLPELDAGFVKLAAENPTLRPAVVGMLAQRNALSDDLVSFLAKTVADAQAGDDVRSRAFDALTHASAMDAAVNVLLSLMKQTADAAICNRLRDELTHHGSQAKGIGYFEKLASASDTPRKQLAFAVLARTATGSNVPKQAKATAQRVIEAAWKSPDAAVLLRAIGDARVLALVDQVRARLADPDQDIAAAAAYAAQCLGTGQAVPAATDVRNTIAQMSYEDVLQIAVKAPGDPNQGAKLFETVGCVKCHTTSKSEPLKGPFLGDIANRYGRTELVESILRPNAQIAQGFVTTWIETKDGTEYDGFISRESGDEVEIRNINGPTVVAKKDIANRGTRATSVMPEGLANPLTPAELASILAYLQSLKAR